MKVRGVGLDGMGRIPLFKLQVLQEGRDKKIDSSGHKKAAIRAGYPMAAKIM